MYMQLSLINQFIKPYTVLHCSPFNMFFSCNPPPAQDFCKDPQLFSGGADRFDVKQGMLGDCWLVSAIASLTQDSILLNRVHALIGVGVLRQLICSVLL